MSRKNVVFGNDDDDLLQYFEENPNIKFSTYVKELIRRDINGSKELIECRDMFKEIKDLITNADLAVSPKKVNVDDETLDMIKGVKNIFKKKKG